MSSRPVRARENNPADANDDGAHVNHSALRVVAMLGPRKKVPVLSVALSRLARDRVPVVRKAGANAEAEKLSSPLLMPVASDEAVWQHKASTVLDVSALSVSVGPLPSEVRVATPPVTPVVAGQFHFATTTAAVVDGQHDTRVHDNIEPNQPSACVDEDNDRALRCELRDAVAALKDERRRLQATSDLLFGALENVVSNKMGCQ